MTSSIRKSRKIQWTVKTDQNEFKTICLKQENRLLKYIIG